jgi:site-specific DNA recombinase
MTASSRTALQTVRCAIYTRKSTEEGLDQKFNSLDAQREAAQAYIASQQHAGCSFALCSSESFNSSCTLSR